MNSSKNDNSLQLGATLSLADMGGDPDTVRTFARKVEALGYDFLECADHVLGVNVASRPDWGSRNTSKDLFHDPFVLYGFLAACTERVELATGVLILAQRQAALVAKQAASVAVLSNGRMRLGVGVGWNPVEFVGLNENFSNRGVRSAEQVELMQALWAEDHVTFKGRWHEIPDAGINPRPSDGRVPVWFGGHVDATLRRIARLGDGWIMNGLAPGDEALEQFALLGKYCEEAGREAGAVGIEVWVSAGRGTPEDWREELRFWKAAGATHICLNNSFARYHHERIPGRTLEAHLDAIERYRDAVADVL